MQASRIMAYTCVALQIQPTWAAVLTEEEAQRGLAYQGSGNSVRRVAGKLLRGEPVQVFTLGGSVTVGASWARLVFDALNASFPHRQDWWR